MKKSPAIVFALMLLLLLPWMDERLTRSLPLPVLASSRLPSFASPGNIADGMYEIVGEASHRCLEVPNSSCASGMGLQTFDCDRTDASNNQKFIVASDGSGNYTISPAHSDLCLEVATEKIGDRTPVMQAECSP